MNRPFARPQAPIRFRRIPRGARRQNRKTLYTAFWSLALLALALVNVLSTGNASAAPDAAVPADASCAVLSRVDASATNGAAWGKTILPGHNVPGGWFGVDVCANGTNTAAPNGSNVSCDRIPSNWASAGCAPGGATSDGYGLTYQCVELVIRFSAWAYGDSVGDWGKLGWGNAPDLWAAGNHPSDFVMYPNGSSTPPVAGDILVWGTVDAKGQPLPAGPDGEHGGHIAVVAAVHGNVVVTAEQNVKWGSQDHPSDTLALTKVGNRWVLSGSMAHETALPTYRWRGTMGTSRATYGWLHSTKNTGKFPSTSAGKTPTAVHHTTGATPAQTPAHTTPQQASGGLPSLSQGAYVVNGALADLVWSTGDPFVSGASSAAPTARLRSLAAPPGVTLANGQRPAIVTESDGRRFVYVVGSNGRLYEAVTSPIVLGVQWQDLGAPANVAFGGSASATLFTGGVAVAAQGSDGSLWWRAGPVGNPGGWLKIDSPASVNLSGAFALLAAPGLGTPTVLALGADGVLYQRVWQPALLDQTGGQQAPAAWSDWVTPHAAPAGVHLVGPLLAAYEATAERASVAPWLGTPLDIFVADDAGHLWGVRGVSGPTAWTQISLAAPAHLQALIAVTVTQGTPAAGEAVSSQLELRLYANDAAGLAVGAVTLPAHGSAAFGSVAWTALPAFGAKQANYIEASALALGPGNSALTLTTGSSLIAGVSSDGALVLAPTAPDSATATASGGRWLTLGTQPTSATFNDSFAATTLSPQWAATDASLTSHVSAGGVQLATGPTGAGALVQSALPGDAAATVRVTLPADAANGQQAGLALYLDAGDWITLSIDARGRTAFCVEVAGQAVPCLTQQITFAAPSRIVWAQIARSGDTYTALVSPDQGEWSVVGHWTAPGVDGAKGSAQATASATPATTPAPTGLPTASPTSGHSTRPATLYAVAPLGFTEWGVFAQGSSSSASATFADFTIAPLPMNSGAQ